MEKHNCEELRNTPYEAHGRAITSCYSKDDGSLWVENGEYASAVNFCPYCGFKAIKTVKEIIAEDFAKYGDYGE